MVLILSYTSGTIELYLLVLLFGLTFVTMLFGHLHEVICRRVHLGSISRVHLSGPSRVSLGSI